jgi:cell division septation protein DedD
MEQKKTLWIIAAVGVFLLVVLGVPAILHYPSRNPVPAYASISPVEKKTTQGGWTKPAADVEAAKVNDLVVLADNATVYSPNVTSPASSVSADGSTTIDLNALKNEIISETQTNSQPQNINSIVNLPENKTSEKTTVITPYAESKPAKAAVAATENVVKTVQKTETKTTKTAKTASQPKPAAQTANPAPKAEPKKTQFWVQVAAYSNKKGAEGARTILDENKIPSDIFTYRDNKDKLYYRVRVGPYTTKSEAEYWRTRIIKISDIDNANDSYITSTTI